MARRKWSTAVLNTAREVTVFPIRTDLGRLRAPSHELSSWADSNTGTNFVVCYFSQVVRNKIRKTKPKWRKKNVSFATIVALSTPVTL